jgi:hypothetical protein
MQKLPTVGPVITRHARVLPGGDFRCLGSGYREMSRSAWTAAVHRRPQRHARPPGTTPTTHLIQTVANNSAFQNQARKQGNQTEIKPSPTKKPHHWSPYYNIRSYPLTGLARVNFVQPILGYSSLLQSIPAFLTTPPGDYIMAVTQPQSASTKIMNAYSSLFLGPSRQG